MNYRWTSRKGNDSLIVFCCGWGMDHRPFFPLGAGLNDILVLYDYRDMDPPLAFDTLLSEYRTSHLVCWSMGVWAGQQLFEDMQHRFDKRMAINGTLRPIDDLYGIPVDTYRETMLNYSAEAQNRFYRRMCREKGVLECFLADRPERTVASQKEELRKLEHMVLEGNGGEPIFSEVIISQRDLVMPTGNQHLFWGENHRILKIEGCHFPFYRWRSWDDLLGMEIFHD